MHVKYINIFDIVVLSIENNIENNKQTLIANMTKSLNSRSQSNVFLNKQNSK